MNLFLSDCWVEIEQCLDVPTHSLLPQAKSLGGVSFELFVQEELGQFSGQIYYPIRKQRTIQRKK